MYVVYLVIASLMPFLRTWNSAAACMVTAGDACSSFRHWVAHFGYSVRDTYACRHILHIVCRWHTRHQFSIYEAVADPVLDLGTLAGCRPAKAQVEVMFGGEG